MEASPKLQEAGRRFLLRLVAENGPEAAAAILRDLADELTTEFCPETDGCASLEANEVELLHHTIRAF